MSSRKVLHHWYMTAINQLRLDHELQLARHDLPPGLLKTRSLKSTMADNVLIEKHITELLVDDESTAYDIEGVECPHMNAMRATIGLKQVEQPAASE